MDLNKIFPKKINGFGGVKIKFDLFLSVRDQILLKNKKRKCVRVRARACVRACARWVTFFDKEFDWMMQPG